jgi:hypothetical protein
MNTIRLNCFETNSSSSHSITLGSTRNPRLQNVKVKYSSITPIDGAIELGYGEYGWGYEKYSDAQSKADYCAIDFRGDEKATADLIKLIKQQTGAQKVIIAGDDGGSIDHQSIGTAMDIYKEQGVKGIKNFIFNPDSRLIIDNDNH